MSNEGSASDPPAWEAASEAARRSRDVFEILVRENAGMLEAYLRSVCPDSSSIDDVFQETMIVAWRRLDEFDRSRALGPWLRGIARVIVMEHARKRGARAKSMSPEMLDAVEERFGAMGSLAGEGMEKTLAQLRVCLDELPAVMREAVELVYFRSVPFAALAEGMGEDRQTVWKRVQRARQALAECLGRARGGASQGEA